MHRRLWYLSGRCPRQLLESDLHVYMLPPRYYEITDCRFYYFDSGLPFSRNTFTSCGISNTV